MRNGLKNNSKTCLSDVVPSAVAKASMIVEWEGPRVRPRVCSGLRRVAIRAEPT